MTNTTLQPGSGPTPERHETNRAVVWGAILLGVGVLSLLSNFGVFERVVPFFWALLFGAGGLAFLYVFLRNTQSQWWAAIPAFALFGLAGTITIGEYAPARIASLGGAVFLGGMALGFICVYLARREAWWALIPGGVMASLAATAAIDETGLSLGGDLSGAVFMIGLGLTFLLVAFAPSEGAKMRWWALIPAAVLLIIGVLLFFSATQYLAYMGYLWGVALIVAGGAVLYRALGQQRQ